MRYIYLIRSAILLAILSLISFQSVHANEATFLDRKAPNWVKISAYDPNSLDGKFTDGPAYYLVDNQRLLGTQRSMRYVRYVSKATTPDQLTEAAKISITYDPSYQQIYFHQLNVIRDGRIIQSHDTTPFEFMRVESDVDKLLYNSDLTASLNLKDIRVGDIVDYSYTRVGENPVFKGRISTRVNLNYSVPVGNIVARLLYPKGRQVKTALYRGGGCGDGLFLR